MPRPKRLAGRRIAWDVRDLDTAVDHLPVDHGEVKVDETWNDVDAPQASAQR